MSFSVPEFIKKTVHQLLSFKGRTRPIRKNPPPGMLGLGPLEDRTMPSLTLTGQSINLTAGQATSLLIATMTDSDSNTSPMAYTSTLNFGDGSGNASALFSWDMTQFGITGFHTYANVESFTVSLAVTDSDGDHASLTESVNVTNPVTVSSISNQTSTEGSSVLLSVSASDPAGVALAYSASGLPPGLAISTSTGSITGTVAAGDADFGPYRVTATAGDGTSSASRTFTWNVKSPIAVTPPADQTNSEGDSVSLSISASDSSGGTLTYGAVGLPAGLSINASTGAITGTVATGAAANGPYPVTLLAGDSTYRHATTFAWNVTCPITITAPADQISTEGASVSLAIGASYSGGSLTYSATGLPNGLSINSSTGAISGTLSAGGSFAPTVTATHSSTSASVRFRWTVSGPITITDPGRQQFNAGDAVSLPIHAGYTGGGTLSYSASGLPTGLSINSGTGVISGTISSSLAVGVYTGTVTVTDGTSTSVDSFAWAVSAAGAVVVTNPGAQSSTEGASASLTISASYSGGGTLSYAAIGLPPGLKINTSTGAITGTVAAGDSAFGPYTVIVAATDGTATDKQSFPWTIASPITLTNPGTQSGTEGVSVSLSISASYGGGSLTYSAVGLPGGLKINASTGAITGTVAAGDAANGPYSVTVQAASGSYAAVQTFTWTVGSPIVVTNPGNQTSAENASASLSLSVSYSGGGTLKYSALGLPTGLKINTGTGAITGTVALGTAAAGPYFVTVVAEDGTYSSAQSFTWTVTSPVTITTPADQTSTEGTSASLSISASGGGTLKYAALGLPTGLKINASTGSISGTVAAGDAAGGPYAVTVMSGDGTYSAQTTFTWNVNSPVSITVPADQTNNQGDTVSLTISASNSAGGTLSYSATGLPNGLSINSSTGAITGTVSAGGFWQPAVTATNGTYSDTKYFNWSVGSAVTITDPGYRLNHVGDSVSLTITAADTAAGTLSYSASGLPSGLSINSSTGVISGTVGGGASVTTPYTPTITVGDGTHSAVDTFTWTILQAGPVVVIFPGDQTNTAGDEAALPVQATTTAGKTLLYTITGLPAGLYVNPNTGMIFGTIDSGASSGSPYTVTVTAGDGTNSASQSFNWTVHAAAVLTLANPGDQTGTEGNSVSLSISTTYSGGGTLAFTASGLPAGLKINTGTGAITGTVALGDAAAGPFNVTVVANDGTYSASQTIAWKVGGPITITQSADQTHSEGDSVSLSISAADSSGGTLSYAALGLPAGLHINASTGAVTGTVAVGAAVNGPYSVTVVATDGTYSANQTFEWNIISPITITVPEDQANNDGDSVSMTISAVDSASGTLSFSAQNLPAGLSINPSTGTISGTIALGDSGIDWLPTIVASDGTYSVSAIIDWDIRGVISIADPGFQASIVGDAVTLPITATDPGGTLSYTALGLPAGLGISTTTGVITGTISSSASSIGSYTTTVITSDGTNTASATFGWTVVAASGTLTLAMPSNQSTAEGGSGSLSLGASYSGGGTLHYFAEGLPSGLHINPSTGAVSGTVAVGDSAYGPYTITAAATDGAISAEETFIWSISGPITITQPANQTSTEGSSVSLSLSTSYSGGGTLKYSAVGLPPGLSINTGTGAITGTIAFDAGAAGLYRVIVVVADGTYSAVQTFSWTVSSPVIITVFTAQTTNEGDGVSLSLSASDSSGGTLKVTAVGLPAGLHINTSTGAITGNVGAAAAGYGPYSVTVTANDGTYSASTTLTWNVNNPITIATLAQQDVSEGGTVDMPLSVTDAHSGTLSFTAFGLPAGLSINAATGEITGAISNGSAAAGIFASTVAVTDGTYSASRTFTWVVAPAGQAAIEIISSAAIAAKNSLTNVLSGGATSFSAALASLVRAGESAEAGLLLITAMTAADKPGAVADIPWWLNPPIDWKDMSVDVGALPDFGYGLLQGAAEEKAEAALTHQVGVKRAIYLDWSGKLPAQAQHGVWATSVTNTLGMQLGIDGNLEKAEALIEKNLTKAGYSSIKFTTEISMDYWIVTRDAGGKPVTPHVGWHAILAIVVTATDKTGKPGYFYKPIGSTDGRFDDERYADYEYGLPNVGK